MTFSKHNWNELSESSKRELKKRQAYQEGYRQGLLERGPAAHTSNRQGQQFDRWGRPIVTAPPVTPPTGPANRFSLAAGDELGMYMQDAMPDDFVPPAIQAKRDAMKKKGATWTRPSWKSDDEDVVEGRRMYEQSGMAPGSGMGIGNAMPGRMASASNPGPGGWPAPPRSGGPEDWGRGEHGETRQDGEGTWWQWLDPGPWRLYFKDSCRGPRCAHSNQPTPPGMGTPRGGGGGGV